MCVHSSTAGDEEYRVLLPFIKDGFECGDRAVHIVNPDRRRDHLQRLAAGGIDTTAAASRVGNSNFGPTRKNTFGMAASIRIGCWSCSSSWPAGNAKGGFPLSRIVCHMDWAAEGRSYVDNLVEFESRGE